MFDEEVKKILENSYAHAEPTVKICPLKSETQKEVAVSFLDAYVKSQGKEVSPTEAGIFLIKSKWSDVYRR